MPISEVLYLSIEHRSRVEQCIAMDKCPQEVYDYIVSFAGRRISRDGAQSLETETDVLPSAFPALSTVSRKFQLAVERYTFKSLHLDTHNLELDTFERILTPRQRRYLRYLELDIVLPSYPRELFFEYETDEDRRTNNKAATAMFRRVFNILAADQKQNMASSTPYIDLEIYGSYSPSEIRDRRPNQDFGLDLLDGRFQFSLLSLTSDAINFPPLPCVRSFWIGHRISRMWSPQVAVLLSSKMVNALEISWDLFQSSDNWGRYYYLDQIYRDGLVKTVQEHPDAVLPNSTKKFICRLKSPNTFAFQPLPRFIEHEEDDDSVSRAIQHITRNCSRVCLEDNNFGVDELDNPPLPDDNLHRLLVGYSATKEERLEADCYHDDYFDAIFCGWTRCEVALEDKNINALFQAFAEACSRMQALRTALLEIDELNPREMELFEVCCMAPNSITEDWEDEFTHRTNSWRVYIRMGDWRATQATHQAFKAIGKKKGTSDAVVRYLPPKDYWFDGLEADLDFV
ncbi:uncharacterized protein F4822DRAFT_57269 [Hypoxylon trugodes]|uniref:uncharacterized protein n=1 Tax=Hypoxylon trugodes TaxID=326681 RepID=UPI002190FA8C|nr:uncharacterized protein F4822DRAFT_57269 [Hypoxylon trugodes]KAI1383972.1 hypothetical protein F4822DRAFT_57269 [Hypoxylon trugodes]